MDLNAAAKTVYLAEKRRDPRRWTGYKYERWPVLFIITQTYHYLSVLLTRTILPYEETRPAIPVEYLCLGTRRLLIASASALC